MTQATLNKLLGLFQSNSIFNFKANTVLGASHQLEVADTTTQVTLPASGATGITINGVFLKADILQTGANFFIAGAFNPTTGVITLGAALPSANEEVWVNYSFTGHTVHVTRLNPSPHQGQSQNLWTASLELTGR